MEQEKITVVEENMEESIEVEVIPEEIMEPVVEAVPEVSEIAPKKKRTQSQKQIDAFVKARKIRAENVLLRKSNSEEAKELMKSEKRKSKKTKELENAIKSTVTVLDEDQVISIINSQKQKRNDIKQGKIDEFEAARKLLGLDKVQEPESSKGKEPVRDRYEDRYEDRYDARERRPRDPRVYYERSPARVKEQKPIHDEVIAIINSQKQMRVDAKQAKKNEIEAARKLLGLDEPKVEIPKVKAIPKPRAPRKPRVSKAKQYQEPTDPSPKNPKELEEFLRPAGRVIQDNPYSDW